jgi:flagellar basal-body rod protein FlgF
MIRGLYTAASGMTAQLANQEAISNNLANVDTTGFKKDLAVNRAFSSLLINRIGDITDRGMDVTLGSLGTGVQLDSMYTDYSAGTVKATENKFDVALDSNGFFVVNTPQGERYTRDGSFTLAANGDLVTKNGYTVLGQAGVINIPNGADLQINQDGSVVSGGKIINQLRVVDVPDRRLLLKQGQNLFNVTDVGVVTDSANFRVLQGYLETSNVNVVSEMVRMITGMRIYEANQKSIVSQDDTLNRLINEAGRV